MKNIILESNMTLGLKIKLIKQFVLPALTYGAEP